MRVVIYGGIPLAANSNREDAHEEAVAVAVFIIVAGKLRISILRGRPMALREPIPNTLPHGVQ